MPVISRFLGIVVSMFWKDHAPAHFHATYGDFEITVEIDSGIVEGKFPPRALKHVLEWYSLHKNELMEDWSYADKLSNPARFNHWSNAMFLHITQVSYISDYKLSVSFNNGENGIADLSAVVHNGVFKALQSQEKFAQVRLDLELKTVAWPGGLDLASEFVYFQAFKDLPPNTVPLQDQFKAWGYVTQMENKDC